jgi:heme-degrading monooxygenase HmoA
MYVRVWEYEVTEDHVDAFIAAYGRDGDWARLFQRGRGYVGTELYRSTGDGARFVTVDRWTDLAAWRAFLQDEGATYGRVDWTMSRLIASQRSLLEGSAASPL